MTALTTTIIQWARLPRLFAAICWEQGVRRAVMLALCRFPFLGRFWPRTSPWPDTFDNRLSWLPRLKRRPLISVVVPVHNSRWLNQTIASVLAQSYDRFELILVDDASDAAITGQALQQAIVDPRVTVIRQVSNLGISGATNVGVAAARGEYIVFLDHDDLLHPDALAVCVRVLNEDPEADVYYADEVTMTARGIVTQILRKCPISLDLLLSCNAVLHGGMIKAEALRALGPLNSEFDGAQDHELMLRAFEQGLRFQHIPFVLYAWRLHAASMSGEARLVGNRSAEYPRAFQNGKRLIREYLQRHQVKAEVTDEAFPWYRVRYAGPPGAEPVAVVIPFRAAQRASAQRLVASLRPVQHPPVRLYPAGSRSDGPPPALGAGADVQIFEQPFSVPGLVNAAVARLSEPFVLLMKPTLEIIRPDALDAMLEHMGRPEVAAVGCRLVDRWGHLRKAALCTHPMPGASVHPLVMEDGFYTRAQREVSAVSADCMLFRRSAFLAVGGFEATFFTRAYYDVDFCLRLTRAGFRIMFTPFAEVCDHGAPADDLVPDPFESLALTRRHLGNTVMMDRHYKVH